MIIISVQQKTSASDNALTYIIGGIIALLILGYLVYTLLHPEKF